MSQWSVKSVQARHAALRLQYERVCLEALEDWLKASVGPAIGASELLPDYFVTPTHVVLPRIPRVMEELVHMASSMGWDFKLEAEFRASFRPSGELFSVRYLDSPWSYDQVYLRHGHFDEVEAFLSAVLEPYIGSITGVPPVLKFSVEHWVKWREFWRCFALLGWSLELKDIECKVHMCLSEKK
jgi:hypothetical protein